MLRILKSSETFLEAKYQCQAVEVVFTVILIIIFNFIKCWKTLHLDK